MSVRQLIEKNRSYRRFREDQAISRETLRELVNLARLSASGGNMQPLKYILSCDAATNEKVFPCVAWAGLLKDWAGPAEGERPSGYIILLGDTEVSKGYGCDHGIAAQSILLGAVEKGLGGCMIGSIKRDPLREALKIPERYEIALVIALGVPAEKVVIEGLRPDGSTKYYRDAETVHHVPKRPLDEIIIG
ncbi:nitroreductase family protein [bacterium]|nr:nitroreductase family protein [bacterium]